jgi:hypothetical protein
MNNKVSVYRNLNCKEIRFSIREKGRVKEHASEVILENASFKHAPPGALNRIRNGYREVCAWITGTRRDTLPDRLWQMVLCDPKKVDYFQDTSGNRIDRADFVHLRPDGSCHYAKENT